MENNDDFMGFVPSTGGNYECLPEGSYDFVVHAIIGLGLRKKVFEGKELNPQAMVKFVFEIPECIREDGQTELLSLKLPISNSEKSNFYKFCTAILGANVTNVEDNMKKLCTASGLKTLLGKTGTLSVITWKNGEGRSVDNKGFFPLHPKVAKPVATRAPVFFNPFSPDIEVFKNNLTAWTRKEIMEALNADTFKDELKQAYQECLKADEAGKKEAAKPAAIDEQAPWATGDAVQ